MKSAYLFACILAPTCIFAHPLDHDEEKSSKPGLAREILEKRSPQSGIGNEQNGFNDYDPDTKIPDAPSGPNTPDTTGTGQPPVGDGVKSGNKISTYANANCKGPSFPDMDLIYDRSIMHQLQSYSLESDLGYDDALGAFADVNWSLDVWKPIDPTLDGNANACAQYAYNLTATVEDTKAGCHTLNNTVGCIMIGVNQPAGS